ncbi:MAG: DUF3179 domain-containing protein [Candidatus Colwellbacteria bacterium]|nr:DUF3179 domain-containing protein [Candidatus Colwellbacteria bacterium]
MSNEENNEKNNEGAGDFGTTELQVTRGVKHIVPLDQIIGGGPPKDGIPPIDNPKFTSIQEAGSLLNDEDPGIAVELNGAKRFYPYKILVWHEIVNDTIGGQRILVTYCPLCFSGIVFDPTVKGERVEFGTSGKLWNSNLVMYDRKTDSLWSQILGQAIAGEMAGTKLKILPSDLVKFGDWKKLNSNGQVLSKDTGAVRSYGTDPYGDYYTTPGTYFPVSKRDDRLSEKELVMGIEVNGKFKAYWPEAVKRAGQVTDIFEGKTIILKYEKDIDAVRIYEKMPNGELVRINPLTGYWFSWAASHPNTELYK